MSAICPECDSTLDLEEADAEVGDELTCSECGALLRVSSEAPLELELADDDDLDEEEEEEEDDDEGDDDDDDPDDEDEDDGVGDDE
jgi:DNA-directed RNA polymerase subunit M/transcription elongation factor TFIIS